MVTHQVPSFVYILVKTGLAHHFFERKVVEFSSKEIFSTPLHCDIMAESEGKLKSLFLKVKEESGKKAGLKLNIQKTKIMASSPIISWQIDEETVETVTDFIFLGSKITEDGDCSHEIKRCLLLGKKAMTNLDSILKRRDMTLPTKASLVKAMVFQ